MHDRPPGMEATGPAFEAALDYVPLAAGPRAL